MTDKSKFNAYHRDYQLRRYHQRRSQAIEQLGGKCVQCGSPDTLEIDHRDRTTKSFSLAKLWGCSKAKFEAELSKCQLLCRACHEEKSVTDLGKKRAKGQHGTVSTYRHCHCADCRKAHAAYSREWKKSRARGVNG